MCRLVLEQLLIFYMYLLVPLVSECAADRPILIRFLCENLCSLDCFKYLVEEILIVMRVIGLIR